MDEDELRKLRPLDLADMRERNRKRTFALYRLQVSGKGVEEGRENAAKDAYFAERGQRFATPEEVAGGGADGDGFRAIRRKYKRNNEFNSLLTFPEADAPGATFSKLKIQLNTAMGGGRNFLMLGNQPGGAVGPSANLSLADAPAAGPQLGGGSSSSSSSHALALAGTGAGTGIGGQLG